MTAMTRRELRLSAQLLLCMLYVLLLYLGSTALLETPDVFQYARF